MVKVRLLFMGLVLTLLTSACAGGERAEPSPTALPVATPTPSLQVRTFEALWSAVHENYVYPDFHGVDWQAIHNEYLIRVEAGLTTDEFSEVLRSMVARLPSGAVVWQTRAERIQQALEDTRTYEGIGAYISFRAAPEPRVVLLSVMPRSPAAEAGLQAHDSILAIDGIPVRADEGESVVRRIRGPAGSRTTLRVRSPGRPPRDVEVTRGRVIATDVLKGGMIPRTGIGYLLFPPAPYDELGNDMLNSLRLLSDGRELNGLILDLRIATIGGGWPLTPLLTLFANGNLGEIYTRTSTQAITVEGQDVLNSQRVPLAILIGPDTQGAPEIFAAALQAAGRAVLVGLPTPGEVEGITEFALPDGSRAFIATSSYRTPTGREIGLTGVIPDVKVNADWDAVTLENDPVRDAAVRALQDASAGASARG